MDMKKIVEKIDNILCETYDICGEVNNCYSCPLKINKICIDKYLREVVIDLREQLLDE